MSLLHPHDLGQVDVALLERVLDHLPDVVFFIKDREARYVAFNRTLLVRTGLDDEARLRGRTAAEVFPGPLGSGYLAQDRQVLESRAPIEDRLELHLYPDGSRGWCVTWKYPLPAGAGLMGLSRDLGAPDEQHPEYRRLATAVERIQTAYDQPLRLSALAQQSGLSMVGFERLVKQVFRLTPRQLLVRQRVDAASHMLRASDATIITIAHACGYADQSAFARQFKAVVGVTPREFRELHHGIAGKDRMGGGRLARMRAIIDIGTNTVLMLLARRDAEGRVVVHDDMVRMTRLGQGAAASGRLSPEAIERTLAALREYRGLAEAQGAELEVVATEGLRMAGNPDAFLEPAAAVLGRPVRLISGDEEAELSFRSVAQESVVGDEPLYVLDIGGGSTELVVGRGPTVLDRRSHPVGSVRLTERLVHHDPPTPQEVEAVATATRAVLAEQPVPAQPVLHGLAGTVTTVAALLLELPVYDRNAVDGSRWSMEQVEVLRDRLAAMTLAERLRLPQLPAGRADVIVAGTTILLEALRHCGASTLVVRDRGLRYALV